MAEQNNIHIPYNEPILEYHRIIAKLVTKYIHSNGKVLDYGCGLGHIESLIHQALPNTKIYAADIDQKCLDITAERTVGVNLIQLNDGDWFSNIGENYDVCIMSHVLEHIPTPEDAVLEIMRILKPGGVFNYCGS